MNETEKKMRIVKFSMHVTVSVLMLLFSMTMLIGDFAGTEYRPIWSGFLGTIVGVWIKKPRLNNPETLKETLLGVDSESQ